ncbi:SsrA-binding protein SmpB [Aureimonas glaciei]|jgi:SsrA-binding protein|uniref:SsrA-binding protein n=1 Tax=Aureimonas glaciei TaxID=1776957 RepID=A0A916XUQ2_9HYPH|nr:SsrA-binding protein SmpB [Aureimonas glaciei]GGD13447.1 SsrA-binding protein [Aureimonas glaciei]
MAKKPKAKTGIVAENRKARHNYSIIDTIEAGMVLTGTEVKSLRLGRSTIAESYAAEEGGELWLINSYVPEYLQANRNNHEPKRRRKLLVHRAQLNRLASAVNRDGMTIVPLKIFFTDRGMAKIEIAVAKGKNAPDKREAEKQKDWNRQKERLLKDNR